MTKRKYTSTPVWYSMVAQGLVKRGWNEIAKTEKYALFEHKNECEFTFLMPWGELRIGQNFAKSKLIASRRHKFDILLELIKESLK